MTVRSSSPMRAAIRPTAAPPSRWSGFGHGGVDGWGGVPPSPPCVFGGIPLLSSVPLRAWGAPFGVFLCLCVAMEASAGARCVASPSLHLTCAPPFASNSVVSPVCHPYRGNLVRTPPPTRGPFSGRSFIPTGVSPFLPPLSGWSGGGRGGVCPVCGWDPVFEPTGYEQPYRLCVVQSM